MEIIISIIPMSLFLFVGIPLYAVARAILDLARAVKERK